MPSPDSPVPAPDAVARWLALPPSELLKGCAQSPFQGPGPGGQKRNRVYSGVRLSHRASGLSAEASERREARRNLEDALGRLRLALALAAVPAGPPAGGPEDGAEAGGGTGGASLPAATGQDPSGPGDAEATGILKITLPDVGGGPFRADASPRHPDYPRFAFLGLLALDRAGGRLAPAAAAVGATASGLARLLRADKAVWARANALRRRHGLHPLKSG